MLTTLDQSETTAKLSRAAAAAAADDDDDDYECGLFFSVFFISPTLSTYNNNHLFMTNWMGTYRDSIDYRHATLLLMNFANILLNSYFADRKLEIIWREWKTIVGRARAK